MRLNDTMFTVLGVSLILAAVATPALMALDAVKKDLEAIKLQQANEQAEAALHDQRLHEEGCRKVDYIPTKHGVRAKWLCPDGTVALGAVKE